MDRDKAVEEALERIVAAAIKIGPCVYTGAHHAPIVHYVARCTGVTPIKGEQGFLTSSGRFVNRNAALNVAVLAGQAERERPGRGELFSENLWSVPDPDWQRAQEAEREECAKALCRHCADGREVVRMPYGRLAGSWKHPSLSHVGWQLCDAHAIRNRSPCPRSRERRGKDGGTMTFHPVKCRKCGEMVYGVRYTGCNPVGYAPPDSMQRKCGACGFTWYETPLDRSESSPRG